MRIAIIGAGNVGGALARALKGKAHPFSLGVRDPKAEAVMRLAADTGADLAEPAAAAKGAEVVILALPWNAAEGAVKGLGDLSGKIVIDCMNPLGMVDGALALTLGYNDSAGEVVQRWLPGAHVVKTLN
ncbi:MAG: NADPH-dependent F420 reductase, partial [Caulobacteraceae bacterium]